MKMNMKMAKMEEKTKKKFWKEDKEESKKCIRKAKIWIKVDDFKNGRNDRWIGKEYEKKNIKRNK